MKVLIIGAGFLGTQIASKLVQSTTTYVTKTKPDLDLKIKQIILNDSCYQKLGQLLKKFDTIVITVAPSTRSDYQKTYSTLAHALHKALKKSIGKTLIYTSSTSVYREKDGGFVNESALLDLEKSPILIEAEKKLLSLSKHRVVIARLSGLYGNNRALTDMLKRYQTNPIAPKMLNLCSDVLAKNFILYAIKYPIRGIFNVSEKTVLNTTLYEEIFFQKPLVDLNAPSFHGGSKQITSKRLKNLPNFFI